MTTWVFNVRLATTHARRAKTHQPVSLVAPVISEPSTAPPTSAAAWTSITMLVLKHVLHVRLVAKPAPMLPIVPVALLTSIRLWTRHLAAITVSVFTDTMRMWLLVLLWATIQFAILVTTPAIRVLVSPPTARFAQTPPIGIWRRLTSAHAMLAIFRQQDRKHALLVTLIVWLALA